MWVGCRLAAGVQICIQPTGDSCANGPKTPCFAVLPPQKYPIAMQTATSVNARWYGKQVLADAILVAMC